MLGPFTLGVFVVFQSLIFLSVLNKRIKLLIKNKYFIFLGTWSVYFIFSSLISQNILNSLESSLFYFRFALYAFSIAFFINNYKNSLRFFTYILNITLIFLLIDGIYQYFTKFDLFGFPQKGNRLSGPFKDEYILGGVIAKILPILIVCNLYFFHNSLKNYLYIFIILLCSGFVILLSGERWSSFFFLSYVIIIFLTLDYKDIRIKLRYFYISFIFLIASIFLLLTFSSYFAPSSGISIKTRLIDFTIEQLNINNNEIYLEENNNELRYTKFANNLRILSIEHHSFYESSIKIFIDNIFFGVGPKNFRIKCNDDKYQIKLKHNSGLIYNGCQTHPHNYYLQLISESGIIGVLPLIFIIILMYYRLIKHFILKYIKNQHIYDNYTLILLIPLLIMFFPLLPGSNFFSSWNSFFIYFIIGFLIKDRFKC